MRVVLDTNVVVSSYLVPFGAPARIVSAWRQGAFTLVASPWLLAEYEHSLNYLRVRRRHGLAPEQIAQNIEDMRELVVLVEPTHVPIIVLDDADDAQVLAAALAGGADIIVSGDQDLLTLRKYQGIRILTPAAFAADLSTE